MELAISSQTHTRTQTCVCTQLYNYIIAIIYLECILFQHPIGYFKWVTHNLHKTPYVVIILVLSVRGEAVT